MLYVCHSELYFDLNVAVEVVCSQFLDLAKVRVRVRVDTT